MLVIVLMAVFADVIQTHDPIATEAADTLARRARRTGWAPITWAVTSTPASSTARACP